MFRTKAWKLLQRASWRLHMCRELLGLAPAENCLPGASSVDTSGLRLAAAVGDALKLLTCWANAEHIGKRSTKGNDFHGLVRRTILAKLDRIMCRNVQAIEFGKRREPHGSPCVCNEVQKCSSKWPEASICVQAVRDGRHRMFANSIVQVAVGKRAELLVARNDAFSFKPGLVRCREVGTSTNLQAAQGQKDV